MLPVSTQSEISSPEPENRDRRHTQRRSSDKTIGRSVPQQLASSDATSSASRTLKRSSPQQPSSREMTPPEGPRPIKYTRTGRVSRANKGKRVHHCEECGKVSNCVRKFLILVAQDGWGLQDYGVSRQISERPY